MKANLLRIGIISMLFLCVIFTGAGQSILTEKDLNESDGLLTDDSETGLQWLDLTETYGITYTDMLSQLEPGGDFTGFRYATGAEVEQLWRNGGVEYIDSDFRSETVDPVTALQNLLGAWNGLLISTAGFTADTASSARQTGILQLRSNPMFGPPAARAYFSDAAASATIYGHWLILEETTPKAPADTTPPVVLSVAVDPETLWPPNHRMVDVNVTALVEDEGSGVEEVILVIVDEYGDLDGEVPMELQEDGSFAVIIQLQAWRNGRDRSGRIYLLMVKATDSSGNLYDPADDPDPQGTLVLVPHSKRKGRGKKR